MVMAVHNYLNNISRGPALQGFTGRSEEAQRVLGNLFDVEESLDAMLPPNALQKLLDSFHIRYLSPLLNHPTGVQLINMLNSNGHGDWYQKLGTYLVKLPLRSVQSILSLVYNVIGAVVFGIVHPLKALTKALGFIVSLLDALQRPQFYVAAGAGAIGAACGQCIFTGLWLPGAVSMVIGTFLLATGLTWDAVRAARGSKPMENRVWNNLHLALQSFVTGLLTGALLGLTHRNVTRVATRGEAYDQFHKYLAQNDYNGVAWSDYYPKEHRIIWSWSRVPAHPPGHTWLSLDPSRPGSLSMYHYSSLAIKEIAVPTAPTLSATAAAQGITLAANTL